jgi:two-component system, NarL family, invasion response regulator UvrY
MQQHLTKLAIADDHLMVRKAIINLIDGASDRFKVILEAANGNELIAHFPPDPKQQPDIVITDIKMPEKDGFETAHWLKTNHPNVKIVVLTMFDDEPSVLRMLRIGAHGYLTKNMDPRELLTGLESVRDKGFCYSEFITSTLWQSLKKDKPGMSPHEIWLSLSDKEKTFVKHTCSELTYNQIAGEMGLSVKTIDGYRDNLFTRFNVKSRVGLVLYALKNEIVSISTLA